MEFAKDRIVPGAECQSAVISPKNRKLTAYHEEGHALVALLTDGAHPVHKATFVPRGRPICIGNVAQLGTSPVMHCKYVSVTNVRIRQPRAPFSLPNRCLSVLPAACRIPSMRSHGLVARGECSMLLPLVCFLVQSDCLSLCIATIPALSALTPARLLAGYA